MDLHFGMNFWFDCVFKSLPSTDVFPPRIVPQQAYAIWKVQFTTQSYNLQSTLLTAVPQMLAVEMQGLKVVLLLRQSIL